MSNMLIESKLEGKKITLELTQKEVETAISICEKNSIESVIVMKRPHKGGALFFTDKNRAAACQDRHNFEYSFTVKLSELKKFKPSDPPPPKADKKDEEIKSLKDLVGELRKDGKENEAAVKAAKEAPKTIADLQKEVADQKKAIDDKDTEIGLQKETITGLENQIVELKK